MTTTGGITGENALTILGLQRDARAMNETAFKASLSPWVLVGPPQQPNNEWSFRTGSVVTVPLNDTAIAIESGFLVEPVKKVRGTAFLDTVLVGRSSSNDIIVADKSVSKLHARIVIRGDDARISDAGSSNGTLFDSELLTETSGRPLKDGAHITFGDRTFYALRAVTLKSLIEKLTLA